VVLGGICRCQLRARVGQPWPDRLLSPSQTPPCRITAAVPQTRLPSPFQECVIHGSNNGWRRRFVHISPTSTTPCEFGDLSHFSRCYKLPIELHDAFVVRRSSVVLIVARSLALRFAAVPPQDRGGSPGTSRRLPSGPCEAASSSSALSL